MEIRRLEKNNWEGMLVVKDIKIQKADLVELVHISRDLCGPLAKELKRQDVF